MFLSCRVPFIRFTSKKAQIACVIATALLSRGMSHIKCRGEFYARTKNDTIRRFPVPDDKVAWDIPFPEYKPTNFTSKHILAGPLWADKEDLSSTKFKWNDVDYNVDRRSHMGQYKASAEGRPLNPVGRTGIQGRGCLGRWGPNHAADPIVTRWKRDSAGEQVQADGLPILQCVVILRGDCKEWALPGGMVDPGENVSKTLQREFFEEAMDSSCKADIDKIKDFFDLGGVEIYRGYVDDPRNTDNSWMETVAVNYHDQDGSVFESVKLQSGDDAIGVQWRDLSSDLKLYASHSDFIEKVVNLHKASVSKA